MGNESDLTRLVKVESKLENWETSLQRLESKVDNIAITINQFATIEEKMLNQSTAVERAFVKIEKVCAEQKTFKTDFDVLRDTVSKWINQGRGAWWVVSLFGGVFAWYLHGVITQIEAYKIKEIEITHEMATLNNDNDALKEKIIALQQEMMRLHSKPTDNNGLSK